MFSFLFVFSLLIFLHLFGWFRFGLALVSVRLALAWGVSVGFSSVWHGVGSVGVGLGCFGWCRFDLALVVGFG